VVLFKALYFSMDVEKVLAENVRGFRKLRGITQAELATQSGIHRNYLADIERGERNITISSLIRVSAALNVETYLLLMPGSARWYKPDRK
jgi:transcriptional regulator with XRE-family HTH domain